MMPVEFKEKTILGGGWSIEVFRAGAFLVGHIRKNQATGDYCYFAGPHNILTASISDPDLEILKKKVAEIVK
jgi:hypothetical protein